MTSEVKDDSAGCGREYASRQFNRKLPCYNEGIDTLLECHVKETTMLKDKVAVITGAGQGIGRVIALTLARAGADIVLASRSHEALEATGAEIEALGRK